MLDLLISCYCCVGSVVSISLSSDLLINLCKTNRSVLVLSKSEKIRSVDRVILKRLLKFLLFKLQKIQI